MINADKEMYPSENRILLLLFAGRDMNPTFPGLCFSEDGKFAPSKNGEWKVVFRSDFSKFPWGITLLD